MFGNGKCTTLCVGKERRKVILQRCIRLSGSEGEARTVNDPLLFLQKKEENTPFSHLQGVISTISQSTMPF